MASIDKTIQSLYNSNIGSAVEKGFSTVSGNYKENAPISCNVLKQNQSKVIIKEDLMEKLAYIRSTISRQKGTGTIEELPFAMLGFKDEQGNINITDIVYDYVNFEHRLEEAGPGSLDTAAAVFDEKLSQLMSNHLQNKDIQHPIVIHGHTHPQHQGVSANLTNNFSLADMNAYQTFQERAQMVNPNAEVIGMVVNEVGDFNAVKYNSSNNAFERMQSVQVEEMVLPSFSSGNYLVEQNKDESARNTSTTIQQETEVESPYIAPKIEKVSIDEIRTTGYYNNNSYYNEPPKQKTPYKSLFSRLKDFVGKLFSSGECKYIDESIRNAKSIANPQCIRRMRKKMEGQKGNELG